LLNLLSKFIDSINDYKPTKSEGIHLMENESILINTLDQMLFDFYSY